MKKLVILDCDGTLVDSQNGIWEAMAHAFSGLGLPVPTRGATLAIVGLSLPEAFAALAPECSPAERGKLSERYRTAFVEMKRDPAHHEPLFEGVGTAVEALGGRKDVILGIATGKSRRGVDRLFADRRRASFEAPSRDDPRRHGGGASRS
jgi:phosphoglycolate phosphatase